MAFGVTLPEVLIVLVVVGTLGTFATTGFRSFRDASLMSSAVEDVNGRVVLARRLAVTRRERVRLRFRDGVLTLHTARDSVLQSLRLTGPGAILDSVRLRPSTLGFNARGQASPGSIYLYRGPRGVRLVINFLGRVRRERF